MPGSQRVPEVPRRFVVHRHRARRLHYDLRLEIDGVLVSWAVPKGPTLDPGARRLAVRVEDHTLEHLDIEGVFGPGRDTIIWDRGTWEPVGTDDPAAALDSGELRAQMYGEKLRGRLVLVHRAGPDRSQDEWLLVHKRDRHAAEGWDPEDHRRSVLSGRTNEELQEEPEVETAPTGVDQEST